MRGKWFILFGVLLLLLTGQELALAQTSANSSQEQGLTNNQEIVTGNQTVVLQSTNAVRSFSVPGGNPLPSYIPVPSHFAAPVTDGNFGSLHSLLGYKSIYTAEEAEALVQKHGKMRVITTCFLPENSRKGKTRLQVLPDIKEKAEFNRQYEQIGVGNYKALDSNTISEQILGIAIQEGLKIGADAMVFQEGASLVQVASGFSLGLFNSFSYVNNGTGNGSGNVSVGGIGYGKGKSAYASNPWLRILFFRERLSSKGVAPQDIVSIPKPPDRTVVKKTDETMVTRLPSSEEAALQKPADVNRILKPSNGMTFTRLPFSEETALQNSYDQGAWSGVHEEAVLQNIPEEKSSSKAQEPAVPKLPDETPSKDLSEPGKWIPSGAKGVLRISYERPADAYVPTFRQVSVPKGFYRVREEDTLAGIAGKKEVYGDPLKWPIIYRMNLDVLGSLSVGRNMREINLPEGTKLRIVTPEEVEENLRTRSKLWVVNVLSATTEEKVSPIVADLAKNNYAVYVSTTRVKEKDWKRIRVGFYRNRAEAEAQGKKITNLLGINNCWVDKVNGMEFREFAGF